MFGKLRGLFHQKLAPDSVQDSVLGELRFNSDERVWEALHVGAPDPWVIRIAGGTSPDPALLSHARDVASDSNNFRVVVSAFLGEQAVRFQGGEDEVLALRLESLNLFWPTRPNDGMIYFEGGFEGRVWRCDYINRTPVELGFDS